MTALSLEEQAKRIEIEELLLEVDTVVLDLRRILLSPDWSPLSPVGRNAVEARLMQIESAMNKVSEVSNERAG